MKFLTINIFVTISCFSIFFPQDIICGLVGGENPLELSDPEVVRLSQLALVKLNENKGLGEEEKSLVEVVKATRQVVSGSLTKLTLKVSEKEVHKYCVVKIWEQPWLNKTEVTHSQCEDSLEKLEVKRTKRSYNEEVLLQSFKDFIKKHNKQYSDEKEYKKRFQIFRANINKIKLLRRTEQGTAQYGVTKFADMSEKEFKKHLGFKSSELNNELPMATIPNVELPTEFDWRHYNAVTSVKNQEDCGSCWAFSVTGNIEGQWAIKKGVLLSLSEQELIDCDTLDSGCEGGYMPQTYKAIMDMGGLETETDYPYEAKDDKCHFNRSEIRVEISGAVNLTKSEKNIAKWLLKNGPVSAALNANAMQFYLGGVSHPPKVLCNPNSLDHGILIVGFGVHKSSILKRTLPYWIIKNSWGKQWGEGGYYRLYRGNGSCGINQAVSSALVK